jgi:pyrrolidone-carboxylate peptidase
MGFLMNTVAALFQKARGEYKLTFCVNNDKKSAMILELPILLLTAFEPFDGRPLNRSAQVAQEIALISKVEIPAVDVRICILPVEYDRSAQVVKEKCLKELNRKPKWVISMGEGGCSAIQLETAAHNWDNASIADNARVWRNGKKIDESAPKSIGFNISMQSLYCGVELKSRARFGVSISPGSFVCNNTAFHLAKDLSPDTAFGFIHVPSTHCGAVSEPKENAKLIVQGLKNIVSTGPMDPRYPTDKKTALERLRKLKADPSANSCHVEFMTMLSQSLK